MPLVLKQAVTLILNFQSQMKQAVTLILNFQSQMNRAATRQREQTDRDELLNTKFTTNAASRESETSILINK